MRVYAIDDTNTPRTRLQDSPDVSRSEATDSTVFWS
jgi:hypothetical protein